MWIFRKLEAGSPECWAGDQVQSVTIRALTLTFCDEGLERGFLKHRRPSLIANFRRISVMLFLITTGASIMGRAWEQDRFPSAEENQTLLFITAVVGCIACFAVVMVAVTTFADQVLGSNYLVLEVLVSMCAVLAMVAHTFALPWYAACALGFDPLQLGTLLSELGSATDTRMVLAIDLAVTGTHLLPVRFYILVIVEVASVLCYVVPTWALGGPELEFAPLTLMFLLPLIGMTAYGKRSLEYQERTHFLSLIRERSLRFQSEFELSQHVPRPGARSCPSEEESRPSTTETARAFMLGDSSVQDLVPVGEREQWLIRSEEMSFRRPPIGEGGYGKVYSGLYNGHPVAIKVPKAQSSSGRPSRSQVMQLCNELRILRKLRHPNIVFFYGACIGEEQSQMALVLELVTGSSLRQFISCEYPGEASWSSVGGILELPPANVERVNLIFGISSALRYLHSRTPCVVHGDLKCSNVFVERACCQRRLPTAKLLDFGLSRALTRNAKPLGGTPRWVAPEVASGSSPDTAADVFSFGCLTFFIATGNYPGNAGWPEAGWLAQACRPSVEECCAEDASSRPRMEQVCRQAEGWLEALQVFGKQPAGFPAGADGSSASRPLADVVTHRASSPSGSAGRSTQELSSLLLPEHRLTPAATVDGMVCDLLLSCNVEVPVQACCHFHAALSSLSRTIARHVDGPCKHWSPRDTAGGQCAGCGLLLRRGPEGCQEKATCHFCEDTSDTFSFSGGSSSLIAIPEVEAIDEI